MRPGWNGNNSYDRVFNNCICSFWHGHGCCWCAFILDKKMNDYVIDQKAKVAFSSSKLAIDWYKRQYYLLLEQNAMLEKECAALREQLNE